MEVLLEHLENSSKWWRKMMFYKVQWWRIKRHHFCINLTCYLNLCWGCSSIFRFVVTFCYAKVRRFSTNAHDGHQMMFAIRIIRSKKGNRYSHLYIPLEDSYSLLTVPKAGKEAEKPPHRIVAESFIYLSKCVVQNDFISICALHSRIQIQFHTCANILIHWYVRSMWRKTIYHFGWN